MNYSPTPPGIPGVVRLRPHAHFVSKHLIWLQIALGVLSIGLIPTLTARPSLGAERLTLSYGLVARSIPINSLETYARTGKADHELAAYVQHADKERLTQLRQVLLTPIPLKAVGVSQFLYTPIGKRLLEELGEVVQQESGISGFYAIRAALILAAADPEGLTLLNVLRKFPSRSISINLSRSLEIAGAFERLVNQSQQAIALINKQSLEGGNTSEPDNTLVRDLSGSGIFSWQKRTITLNDTSRDRTFAADIYLPNTSSPRPVIVISHGLGSDRTSFAYLAEHLASYGFVVAVPEHPGSNAEQLQALLVGRAAEVTSAREFIDRPLDIKYLLDQLSRLSQFDSTYKARLNMEQVGVVGQSFGGYTALALAGAPIDFKELAKNCPASPDVLNVSLLLQCLAETLPQSAYNLSDSRVKAVIAINPIDSSIMGQASLSQINIPVMIVASSVDTVAPALLEQIQPFTWLTTPSKYLALINGATHFSTIGESPDSANSAIPLPEQVIGPSPSLARRYVMALGLPFFRSYVANDQSYRRYLSADYVTAISQEPLPLSLVQSVSLQNSGSKAIQRQYNLTFHQINKFGSAFTTQP
ncbi:alpha/beta hydrolase [Mastigocladopsis repens]|uniref:alpha/beta hydrolase n=1 Tax=Mastigocladopsis repens TaxID=221287 RepID=UPI0002D883A7|nr:alpha/beta hydrolase [Mastigocladopsis repens]